MKFIQYSRVVCVSVSVCFTVLEYLKLHINIKFHFLHIYIEAKTFNKSTNQIESNTDRNLCSQVSVGIEESIVSFANYKQNRYVIIFYTSFIINVDLFYPDF